MKPSQTVPHTSRHAAESKQWLSREIISRSAGLALVAIVILGFSIPSSATGGREAATGAAIAHLGARAAAPEPAGATITFRKIFKTSYPEFVEIKVTDAGTGAFDIRQLDEQASLQPFEIGQPTVQKIFELAGKLHNFQGVDLDVHRRLATLGQKTLRYEKGTEAHEVTFNYTLDQSATELLNIFEGITRQETDLSDLVRAMHYDRLGVNDVLLQIETDYTEKLFPEPERLLPALDQVAADEKFIEIARQRARTLAGRIRASH
jgi:hypothetical protein